jgi:1-acyl-sn-glycerol-3-phosphate acyltransferase
MPRRSPLLLSFFSPYVRRYAARHLHAVRLSRGGTPPSKCDKPILIVLNHPSWWDPLICVLLSRLFPGRSHYAPIEAAALARYRFFERLGFFGIEPGTVRGGVVFMRTSLAILAKCDSVLWVTAQGRFADPRERPLRILPGVGRLASRLSEGMILPLALEYPFWNERKAEALARFGAPLIIEAGQKRSADEWTTLIERQLQATQDALAEEASRRDPANFDVLVTGGSGVGGVYDLWRRLRAWFNGERFRSEHEPARSPSQPEGASCQD